MTDELEAIDDTATLDPPGSIAVVGAGPLGIEAALYGRFLGYDVTMIDAVGVAESIAGRPDDPIPMLPDRCLSPLAKLALDAHLVDAQPRTLPITRGQWLDQVWLPLADSDLLRGRLKFPLRVTAAEIETEEPDDESSDDFVPADFCLRFDDGSHESFEAVILTSARAGREIQRAFELPQDYWFEIGAAVTGDAEADFWSGLKQIVAVFASLGGRAELDLYRPQRG